ncbi:hypothetical protein BGX31_002891 [Mortierella sp. GBA43]|nr:hypothetical protein BGX31_002891 [Mortierella sp. GBA43]
MDTAFIAWAKENRVTVEGRMVEHVSFLSFVKNFALTDQSDALANYTIPLTSSELSAHTTFMKNRLFSGRHGRKGCHATRPNGSLTQAAQQQRGRRQYLRKKRLSTSQRRVSEL